MRGRNRRSFAKGTESSNPSPSRRESTANLTAEDVTGQHDQRRSQANADGVLLEAQHNVAAAEVARKHAILDPVNRLAVALAVRVVHRGRRWGAQASSNSTMARVRQ